MVQDSPDRKTKQIAHYRAIRPCNLLILCYCMCVCVCVAIPFILDVRVVDAPAGVTQKEGRTRFFHLSSAGLAFILVARRIQPFLSLVDREVESCVLTN